MPKKRVKTTWGEFCQAHGVKTPDFLEPLRQQVISFVIRGRLSGLNEYTRACRTNRYAGAKMKEENELRVKAAVLEQLAGVKKISGQVHITYKWYEKNKRRDLDNIAFARKFIQDALVDVGLLQGDGWQHIVGFADEFYIDNENPRIEVIISEV